MKVSLKEYIFDVIGMMMEVTKELPCGLPEYIYQEALDKLFAERGLTYHKEYQCHPIFHGIPLQSYMRFDFLIEREKGNIIIECKAVEQITAFERQQLFSYLIGSKYPIGILVNFAHYPNPYIEKYYYDKEDNTITCF